MRDRIFRLVSLILLLAVSNPGARQLSAALQTADDTSQATILEGATIIDGLSNAPIKNAVLVIEGGTIRNAGKKGSFQLPAKATKINLSGKTIIPGIICAHGHIAQAEGLVSGDEIFTRARIERDAKQYLYYGVTHMISLGSDKQAMVGYLADQQAGKTTGARIFSAGVGFAAKGGSPTSPLLHHPGTPEEARALVQKELAKHPDLVKIWADDALGKLPGVPAEVYAPILEEARKQNVKVAARVFFLETAKDLIRRGISMLATSVQDREVDEEFLQLAKENGITQTPMLTRIRARADYAGPAGFLNDPGLGVLIPRNILAAVASPEYRKKNAEDPDLPASRKSYDMAAKNAKKIAAAGIPIAIGSDSGQPGFFPGLWEHREMELLVGAGLTPMEAIRAATINGAKFLGIDSQYGSITAGKVANFVVLNADPLSDITNTRKIAAVWVKGKAVDRASLAR